MSAPALLRPRANTELLDASVEVIRRHYGTLATVVALWQLPAVVFSVVWPIVPSQAMEYWRTAPGLAVTRSLLLLAAAAGLGLMLARVVDDLLHGRAVPLGASLRATLARIVPATAGYLIKYLVLVLWAMLLFLPAIWAAARYFAFFSAMGIEGLGPLAAIRRSKQLARGNNLRVIAVAGIPMLLVMIIMIIVQQSLVAMVGNARLLGIAGAVATILLYPFMAVPAILLYYDIRTRREGLDLDVGALAPSPSPSAAA